MTNNRRSVVRLRNSAAIDNTFDLKGGLSLPQIANTGRQVQGIAMSTKALATKGLIQKGTKMATANQR